MKLSLKVLAQFAFILIPQGLFAGGWVSSGGHLDQDRTNPWFVSHPGKAGDVTYCILHDPSHFSAPLEQIRRDINRALAYWKTQFGSIEAIFQIGGEDFRELPCEEGVDLVLQFGVLSDVQERYLENPRSYVSVAVRTDYDRVNMRGKGFIYVSPDSGDLKFDVVSEWDTPWQEDLVLYGVLIHEFGHIFGIQHFENFNAMDAKFPRNLILGGFEGWGAKLVLMRKIGFFRTTIEQYFMDSEDIWGCPTIDEVRQEFFGVTDEMNCLRVVAGDQSRQGKLLGRISGTDTWRQVGTITYGEEIEMMDWRAGIRLYFPPEQKVFPGRDPLITVGQYFETVDYYEAEFENLAGNIRRNLIFQLGSYTHGYQGVMNNKIIQQILF
jgi:hypothetical protein